MRAPETPETREEFADLIRYRGAAERQETFEYINDCLEEIWGLVGMWDQAYQRSLDALVRLVRPSLYSAGASGAAKRVEGAVLAEVLRRDEEMNLNPNMAGVTMALVELRCWLNLAALSGELDLNLPPMSHKIMVNGRYTVVTRDALEFRDIALLANLNPTGLTVTYAKGPAANRDGTLREGQSVEVCAGMVFNAHRTDGA